MHIQLGRAKGFVGSHAQMFKGLFKFIGVRILHVVEPFLEYIQLESQGPGRVSSDIYMGQQCLAAEIVGGLVRGMKYWGEVDEKRGIAVVKGVLEHVMKLPETESVGLWASCMRFCSYDRHPIRIRWLISHLFDHALPAQADNTASCSVTCKRLMMIKPLLKVRHNVALAHVV